MFNVFKRDSFTFFFATLSLFNALAEAHTCHDTYLSIDYLHWNICRSGLDFSINGNDPLIVGPGQLTTFETDSDNGYRIYFSQSLGQCGYVGARYTYYHAHPTTNILYDPIDEFVAGATRLAPASGSLFGPNDLLNVDADYSILFNMIDLEIGTCDYTFKCFSWRPFLAARFAWVDQHIKTTYTSIATASIQQDMNMDSYGAICGVQTAYKLVDKFNITARATTGALYGSFDRKVIEENLTTELISTDVVAHSCRPIICSEVSINLEYNAARICHSQLTLGIGYELHTFFNFEDFIDFPSSSVTSKIMRDTSSLLFHGVIARAGLLL